MRRHNLLFVAPVWPERSSSAAGVRTSDLIEALKQDWNVHFLRYAAIPARSFERPARVAMPNPAACAVQHPQAKQTQRATGIRGCGSVPVSCKQASLQLPNEDHNDQTQTCMMLGIFLTLTPQCPLHVLQGGAIHQCAAERQAAGLHIRQVTHSSIRCMTCAALDNTCAPSALCW